MADVKDWRFARVITMVLLAAMTLLVMMAPTASASTGFTRGKVSTAPAPNNTSIVPDWKDIAGGAIR
jgi:hypothetical protein